MVDNFQFYKEIMSALLDRIAVVAKNKNITIGALERFIGASKGVLSRAIQGNTDVQSKWLEKIVEKYPQELPYILLGKSYTELLADRISQIIVDLEYEKLGNIADCFGITNLELGNFTNNMIFPSKPFDFEKFLNIYPEYNYQWILTGDGERFNIDEETALKTIKQRIYEKNHPEYFPKKNELAAKRVDPQEMTSGKPVGIPLIPYAAFAGYGSESFQDLIVEDYYIVREFKDADFLLRIKGDSMSPKFAGGDVVACKLVDGLTFWQWHKIYAICTRTQGILIKRVEEYPNNPAFITCCSDNPQYKPFQIHEDEICAIALVLGAIVIE